MLFSGILQRFAEKSPITVMVRGTLENVFSQQAVDRLFVSVAERQYAGKLLFSSVVDLLCLAVCGVRKSVHEAYTARREDFQVAVKSVYNKLNGTEPEVSRALVRETARRLRRVVKQLRAEVAPLFPGFRTKIIDGNHLAATEHRLRELRSLAAGPLPGLALVVLEPESRLISDVFPCEDAHAQERSLLPQVLETVVAKDVWIADRNFCTLDFLFGLAQRQTCFVIRQHANLPWEPIGRRKKVGESETGTVYEQRVRLVDANGRELFVRRTTVELFTPTRHDETQVHVLSNLPKRISGLCVAAGYHERWTIENAFQELGQALESEIKTLAYPRAALLGFCVGLIAYNAMSLVKSALHAKHGVTAEPKELSGYYLAAELGATYHGMELAVPDGTWTREFGKLSERQLANVLKKLAGLVRIEQFRKHTRGPKKPPTKRKHDKRRPHVSTEKILRVRRLLAAYN